MKGIHFLILLYLFSGSTELHAQNNLSPFFGSVNAGTGVSTIMDFNSDFNGLFIPYHFGFNSNKWLSSDFLLTAGISLALWGTRKVVFFEPYQGGSSQNIYEIGYHSIDIPIIIFRRLSEQRSFYLFGVRNSYIPKSPYVSDGARSVTFIDDVFRKFCIAGITGFGIHITEKIRTDIIFGASIISLVAPESKQIFENQVNYYKSHLYPIDLTISINYCIL